MPFITQGPEGEQAPYGVNKTNWKFLLIVIILAIMVGGGILAYQYYWVPTREVKIPEIPAEKYCKTDEDCTCGVHKTNKVCFYGNKNYVDINQQCPDFCTGIGGNLQIRCINNECKQISITQDETAVWKTYTNTGYKYEIKYPEDWFLSEFCEGIPGEENFCDFKKAGFSSKETYDKISHKYASITNGIPNVDDINIWVVLKSSKQSLRDYVIYLATKIEHYDIDQVKIEEKKNNKGIDFLLYTNPTLTTHQTAFFEKDNIVYEIESHADDPNSETKSKVFNQMLSTFRFLE
jgi:hypothetical protein